MHKMPKKPIIFKWTPDDEVKIGEQVQKTKSRNKIIIISNIINIILLLSCLHGTPYRI